MQLLIRLLFSLRSVPFCRTALRFYGADKGCRHNSFDVFSWQNTLASKEDFPKKYILKRKNQMRQPTFAPEKLLWWQTRNDSRQ